MFNVAAVTLHTYMYLALILTNIGINARKSTTSRSKLFQSLACNEAKMNRGLFLHIYITELIDGSHVRLNQGLIQFPSGGWF